MVGRIVRNRRVLAPLAYGPCGGGAWVLLAYADRGAVRQARRLCGARVMVAGWLTPQPRARHRWATRTVGRAGVT
jgi:hypothetical protein